LLASRLSVRPGAQALLASPPSVWSRSGVSVLPAAQPSARREAETQALLARLARVRGALHSVVRAGSGLLVATQELVLPVATQGLVLPASLSAAEPKPALMLAWLAA
jgi:hypothetical protein